MVTALGAPSKFGAHEFRLPVVKSNEAAYLCVTPPLLICKITIFDRRKAQLNFISCLETLDLFLLKNEQVFKKRIISFVGILVVRFPGTMKTSGK